MCSHADSELAREHSARETSTAGTWARVRRCRSMPRASARARVSASRRGCA
ncbi:hypothetical protein DB32_000173 [Sandaracinus amylolyticus]|uniref:Uncharacterized protein n=1 Tax=Sandaracinus amylolyticus TaxID=927083 RepID=A0A0F6SD89_9BACT|nr:hypothetical protein DB32_000173 [Sandaracinus amylolyticus]